LAPDRNARQQRNCKSEQTESLLQHEISSGAKAESILKALPHEESILNSIQSAYMPPLPSKMPMP
jgi:vacuolar-type H+-ATPase subunit E/Vma4